MARVIKPEAAEAQPLDEALKCLAHMVGIAGAVRLGREVGEDQIVIAGIIAAYLAPYSLAGELRAR